MTRHVGCVSAQHVNLGLLDAGSLQLLFEQFQIIGVITDEEVAQHFHRRPPSNWLAVELGITTGKATQWSKFAAKACIGSPLTAPYRSSRSSVKSAAR